jgi:hypothetical protein
MASYTAPEAKRVPFSDPNFDDLSLAPPSQRSRVQSRSTPQSDDVWLYFAGTVAAPE